MSGVIGSDGVQWERCNGCGEFERMESLTYVVPSERVVAMVTASYAKWNAEHPSRFEPLTVNPNEKRDLCRKCVVA